MRLTVGLFLLMCGLAPQAAAPQPAGGAASGKRGPGACSLLTREMVTQFTPYEKQVLTVMLGIAPSEDALASGSSCEYGGVNLQVDPFSPQFFEKQRRPDWVPVPDVGDAAYFRDNSGQWAELYARAGARVLTLQMSVPTGRTVASIKPNIIAMARAVLPKLK